MILNEREAATVLFALRYLQSNLDDLMANADPNEPCDDHFMDNHGNTILAPSDEFIDELCMKINMTSTAKRFTPVFDKFNCVSCVEREAEIREFVTAHVHQLKPFEDDWYGNDRLDVNAWTMNGVIYFTVYPVNDGDTDTNNELAYGKIVEEY